jgi:hypothetical protein
MPCALRARPIDVLAGFATGTQLATRMASRTDGQISQTALCRGSGAYEQAISLASHSGSADRLISYFGLTEGEASLVQLLHGTRRDASPHR